MMLWIYIIDLSLYHLKKSQKLCSVRIVAIGNQKVWELLLCLGWNDFFPLFSDNSNK